MTVRTQPSPPRASARSLGARVCGLCACKTWRNTDLPEGVSSLARQARDPVPNLSVKKTSGWRCFGPATRQPPRAVTRRQMTAASAARFQGWASPIATSPAVRSHCHCAKQRLAVSRHPSRAVPAAAALEFLQSRNRATKVHHVDNSRQRQPFDECARMRRKPAPASTRDLKEAQALLDELHA